MSVYNGVSPTVFLGNQTSGLGADDTRSAFNKYNNHTHWTATPGDWRYHNISIGDEIKLFNCDNVNILGTLATATVEYISGNKLRVSSAAVETVENGVVLIGTTNPIEIGGVSAITGSNILTFWLKDGPGTNPGLPGIVKPYELGVLAYHTVGGRLLDPEAGRHLLVTSVPITQRLVRFRLQGIQSPDPYATVQLEYHDGSTILPCGSPVVVTSTGITYDLVKQNDPLVTTSIYPNNVPISPLRPGWKVYLNISSLAPEVNNGLTTGNWTRDISVGLDWSLHFIRTLDD